MKEIGLEFIKEVAKNVIENCSEDEIELLNKDVTVVTDSKKFTIDFDRISDDYEEERDEIIDEAFDDVDVDTANEIIDYDLTIGRTDTEEEFNHAFRNWTPYDIYQLSENNEIDTNYDTYVVVNDDYITAESFSDLGEYLKDNYKDETIEHLDLNVHQDAIDRITDNIEKYITEETIEKEEKEGE